MLARVPPVYSRLEYLSDAAVHVSGIALALIGAPILVTLAAVWLGDAGIVTAMTVYAVSLVAMLTCSALYNMITHRDWNDTLRRIDQSTIYLKIAGTYTPFIAVTGAQAGWLLAGSYSRGGGSGSYRSHSIWASAGPAFSAAQSSWASLARRHSSCS